MNKILTICILLITGTIFAQAKKTAVERAEIQTNKMKTELKLTDEQEKNIYQINLDFNQKNDEIRNSRMNEESKKRSFHQNNEARKEKISHFERSSK